MDSVQRLDRIDTEAAVDGRTSLIDGVEVPRRPGSTAHLSETRPNFGDALPGQSLGRYWKQKVVEKKTNGVYSAAIPRIEDDRRQGKEEGSGREEQFKADDASSSSSTSSSASAAASGIADERR